MWQNKRQFQTGVAINDKSQGTVARHLRYCGIFNDCLLQIHCWVCLWKSFKISQHLQSYRQQIWLSRAFYASGYLKYQEFPSDFQYDKITSILTWPLSNWSSDPFWVLTCLLTPSETATERWWCAKRFHCRVQGVFCLRQLCTVSCSVGCSVGKYIFLSAS